MSKRDYYEVLGINKNATESEIKVAFRKKAMEFHPDRNKSPDAEAKFKEVNEAYEVLSDPKKKQMYDQYGHNAFNGQQGGYGGGQGGGGFEDIFSQFFGGQGGGGEGDDLGDIFSQFFGGSRRSTSGRYSNRINKNIEVQINISVCEAAKGVVKKISYEYKTNCPHCHGTGAQNPNDIKTCPQCHGRGKVIQEVNTPFGRQRYEQTCSHCHGRGKIITEACSHCHGRGYVTSKNEQEINIPAGIENGSIFKVGGGGNQTPSGTGDLLIHIYIEKSRWFELHGDDLYVKVIIDPLTAICGGTIDVPTPYGIIKHELKPGTQQEERIKIPGYGVNKKKGFFGGRCDLIAVIIFANPSKYSKDELEKLKSVNNKVNNNVEEFIAKVKKEIN